MQSADGANRNYMSSLNFILHSQHTKTYKYDLVAIVISTVIMTAKLEKRPLKPSKRTQLLGEFDQNVLIFQNIYT